MAMLSESCSDHVKGLEATMQSLPTHVPALSVGGTDALKEGTSCLHPAKSWKLSQPCPTSGESDPHTLHLPLALKHPVLQG
eukprot:CAMPEP_0173442420 /NCGR_PEP_ID=MMETSP1357-20121228/26873_1 /TAXON_ID=77926 /ORGANISM="Hemiselmis rufescens, Strain PCC563" /LENGTH=80 /DNA_ID=CAMNT_0014408169 /DNA_START=57 /DNA_END=295 /DNA_ORIENTATION=-